MSSDGVAAVTPVQEGRRARMANVRRHAHADGGGREHACAVSGPVSWRSVPSPAPPIRRAATLSPANPTVSWGGDFPVPAIVTVLGVRSHRRVTSSHSPSIWAAAPADLEVVVTEPGQLTVPGVEIVAADGTVIADGQAIGSATATVEEIAAGTYTVRVHNGAVTPLASYTAVATLTPGPPAFDPATAPGDTVLYDHDDEAPVAVGRGPAAGRDGRVRGRQRRPRDASRRDPRLPTRRLALRVRRRHPRW